MGSLFYVLSWLYLDRYAHCPIPNLFIFINRFKYRFHRLVTPWTKPIVVGRHAHADQYKATDFLVRNFPYIFLF